nr:hypothetical protein [uncultured Roseateles sp.]
MKSTLRLSRSLIVLASLVAVSSAIAQDFARAPLPESYPLLGRWRTELPHSKCVEEFEIRADGTRSAVSAQEQSESEFRMSWGPSGEDFFKWEDKVVKTNGKPGCSGAPAQAGLVSVRYVRIHPDGGRFLLCTREDMNSCLAEFFYKGP